MHAVVYQIDKKIQENGGAAPCASRPSVAFIRITNILVHDE